MHHGLRGDGRHWKYQHWRQIELAELMAHITVTVLPGSPLVILRTCLLPFDANTLLGL